MTSRSAAPPARTRDRSQRPSGHVLVVGGGIAGLAAAHRLLVDAGPEVTVTLLESDANVGGKLRVSRLAGIWVDEGAESMQSTRPEAVGLARTAGLAGQIVYPAASGQGLWVRGAVRPMPASIMGVPTDLRALTASGVLPVKDVLRMPMEPLRPETTFEGDVSVGAFVEARLGRPVVDTLVEPLLGTVYAGRADALSLRATVPTLYREVRQERSLLRAAARVARGGSRESGARRGPVFASISGGIGRLPGAVAADIVARGGEVITGLGARSLHRDGRRWRVIAGPLSDQRVLTCDAVVLAVPAYAATGLLAGLLPGVSADLGLIPYAGMAVVALAYRRTDVPSTLSGSGFLVPPSPERVIKGVTYSSAKWPWMATMARSRQPDGLVLMRASLGRVGEESLLERDDADIVALTHRDIADAIGVRATPVATRVTRWSHGLPQYNVGHTERIERVRRRVADVAGLELAGAHFDGVGVAAVIGSGRSAASAVLQHLAADAQSSHG